MCKRERGREKEHAQWFVIKRLLEKKYDKALVPESVYDKERERWERNREKKMRVEWMPMSEKDW